MKTKHKVARVVKMNALIEETVASLRTVQRLYEPELLRIASVHSETEALALDILATASKNIAELTDVANVSHRG